MGHAEVPFRDDTGWARMPKPLEAVNDFVVKFANVNGSGSASANGLFAKSVLRMGVPASSRNIFPSNIQGLPTWYEVRISEGGHLGRRGGVDTMAALHLGRDWAQAELACPIGLRLERRDKVGERIFVTGNDAAALGAVYGGATVCAWYPITPSSSLAEAFASHCRRYRRDPDTKKSRYAIIQAEDELASIGMVIGAGWNGARAFTATSGPGISLMQEFIGLAYFAEIPAVIFDIQRGTPSTGMPTRTQQADIISAAYASHGDTKHVLLFPKDPNDSFTFAADALDLADRLQTPIVVMLDLDIGMNEWLVDPLCWDPARKYDRGKVMNYEMLEAGAEFGRYLDVDSDGIPYRTLPGTHPTRGAFFTRGTSKDRYARYSEEGPDYVDNMQRLLPKFESAKRLVPHPVQPDAREQTRF